MHLYLILLKADFFHHTHRSLDLQHLPPTYAGMNFCEPETPKPYFHMEQDSPYLQTPLATPLSRSAVLSFPNSYSWHQKHPSAPAKTRQLLSQRREGKQREGLPTQPLFQELWELLCCCNLCQVSFRKIKFADFKAFLLNPHPPSFFPFPRLWLGAVENSFLWNVFSKGCSVCTSLWNRCRTEACC